MKINSDDFAFLLSYPRSANTWVRLCVEYLSKRSTSDIPLGRIFTDFNVDLQVGK